MLDEEFYDDEDYENYPDDDWDWDDGLDEYLCLFPDKCIALGFNHHQDECYTAEMAYEQDRHYTEQNRIDTSRLWRFYYSLRDFFSQRLLRSLLELPEDYKGELPF